MEAIWKISVDFYETSIFLDISKNITCRDKSSRPKDFSSGLTRAQEVAQIEAKDILNLGKILPGQTNSQVLRNIDPRGKNPKKLGLNCSCSSHSAELL